MCTQKPPNNWSEHLYNNYCDAVRAPLPRPPRPWSTLRPGGGPPQQHCRPHRSRLTTRSPSASQVKEYLSARILPRIRDKHDESMLRELVRRWTNHKLMIRFLSHVFKYLDRFYVKRLSLPELAEVGNQSFLDIVFSAVKRDVRAAILELIRKEREGEMIDKALVKEVVEIFVEMGSSRNSLEVYVSDFEDMLHSTTVRRRHALNAWDRRDRLGCSARWAHGCATCQADFYSRESSKWAEEDSFPDYMIKAEDRLQQEQRRVADYLHSSTEEKLLTCVDVQLLQGPEQVRLEKVDLPLYLSCISYYVAGAARKGELGVRGAAARQQGG